MPGHILVIPIRHVEKLSDLNEQELLEIMKTVIEYQKKILTFAKGCTIHNNYMPFLPESRTTVDHLHIHLWSRENKDELYEKMLIHQHDLFHDLSQEDIEKYIELMKY